MWDYNEFDKLVTRIGSDFETNINFRYNYYAGHSPKPLEKLKKKFACYSKALPNESAKCRKSLNPGSIPELIAGSWIKKKLAEDTNLSDKDK